MFAGVESGRGDVPAWLREKQIFYIPNNQILEIINNDDKELKESGGLKMVTKRFGLIIALAMSVVLMFACSDNGGGGGNGSGDNVALVGTWKLGESGYTFVFNSDNTMIEKYGGEDANYNYSVENGIMNIIDVVEIPFDGGDVLELEGMIFNRVGSGSGIVGTWRFENGEMGFKSNGRLIATMEGKDEILEYGYSYSNETLKLFLSGKDIPYTIEGNNLTLEGYPYDEDNLFTKVE